MNRTMNVRASTGEIVPIEVRWSKKYSYWHRPGTSDLSMVSDCVNHYKHVYSHADLKDAIVLDLGANIGAFAKYAIEHGAKQVICVEPETTNVEMIALNLKDLITQGKVIVFEAAIVSESFQDDTITFYLSRSAKAQCSGSLTKERNRPIEMTVPTVKLSDLERQYGHFKIVKCDIEGGEYDLLKDGLIQKDRSVLAMELHAGSKSNSANFDHWSKALFDLMNPVYVSPNIVFGKVLNTDAVYYARNSNEPV